MILEFLLMAVSVTVMAFLLIHKYMEINRTRKTAIFDIRQKTDPVLRNLHQTTDHILSHVTLHNTILLANHIFVFIVKSFMNISHTVHTVSSNIVEKASKKRENISRVGATSFYMKQIKKSKTQGGVEEEKM
ncbi:MAG: hypothetical protein Q7R72_01440 [bacterium]|nr:hypothetical protein [bacterium]